MAVSPGWVHWVQAVTDKARVSARWAYPHDLSDVRAEGRIIGYCDAPQVLIETDSGEHVWWRADLTVMEVDDAHQ